MLGISATAAMATTTATWTVSPGGAVTGSAGMTTLKDTTTGTVLTCVSSATAANLKTGSGQKSPWEDHIGHVHHVHRPGWPEIHGDDIPASPSNPWNLNAKSYNATTGVTKGSITKVTAALSGNGCNATVAGTTSTSTGTTNGSYSNKTHVLTASGGNLHVYNVNAGCLGLINSGDGTTFAGKYKISPAQHITSP